MKILLLKKRVSILAVLFVMLSQLAFSQEAPDDLSGEDLKSWLITNYYDGNHQTLGYSTARVYLYNYIDNEDGVITCVYSGYEVNSTYGGTTTYPAPINCEHTIPQSFFDEANPMVSDLHHLYPTYENWNSTRSNYPFAEIDDSETAKWMYLDGSQTTTPTSNIDLYSEYANSTFEPREDHKGNVARSIFYFYTMYPTEAGDISAIGDTEVFYQWHLDDPVDAAEIERNGQIETYQGDRNPYIDYPELVARAWGFLTEETAPSTPSLQINAGETSITLSWADVSSENGYNLYKSTDGSTYSLLSDITANTTSYTDNSVSEDITYYYYILAYNDYGNSSNSSTVSGELGSSGNTGTGISVSEALAVSTGTDITVDGIITESYNGIYAIVIQDIDGTETIVVKLESDQRDEWSPDNNSDAVGKTIEVVGTRDTYASEESIEYVTSITEISGTTEDTEAPTSPTSLASASISETSFTLSWTASTDNVAVTSYNVYQGGSLIGTSSSTSYSVTGLSASTTYTYYVTSEDATGNVSDASNTLSVTTSDETDNEDPTAPTSLASTSITETSFTLSWTASTDNVAITEYNIYQGGSLLATTSSTSYSVTSLTASTTYTYYITAEDAAGNISDASSTLSVTTDDADDTEAPTTSTSLASASITETSFTLSWTASTDNVAVTSYNVYQGGSLLGTSSSTSYSVTGLSASTTYTYYVTAEDAAGNVSDASSTLSVTTSDEATVEYCESEGSNYSYEWIEEVTIDTYTNSSSAAGYTDFTSETITLEAGATIDVSLTSGFASSTYNEYWKIWIDYDNDAVFDDDELAFDAGTLSKTTVTGSMDILSTASGTTTMRVSMKYNAEQTACETFSYGEVEDYTVTFGEAIPDTEAPTTPTSLASSVTSSTVTLSWTASTDNVAVDQYNVYQNGSLAGTSSTNSYTATDLSSSTSYSYYVTAEDAAGNVSSVSSTVTTTTSDVELTYCTTTGNNVYYEWIDLVEIGSISNSTSSNDGYADFTSLSTSVSTGENVSINVSCGFKSSSYTEYWHVWIDWNQDGTFDSDEEMATGSSSSSGTLTYTFTVPSNALAGSTRMRVTMKYNATATACETFSYGEVEDYTINISGSKSSLASSQTNNAIINNLKCKIYPNPASSYTTLELISEDETNISYKIVDIQGRILATKDKVFVDGYLEEKIDISNLQSGIYFIMISNSELNETFKLIVK